QQLGSYTLERKIGQGGMAKVYLARHAMLKRPTAVKVLENTKPTVVKLFEHEVQQTSRLSHPNTIAIYDYGLTPEGRFYYAMEFLDGINLKELLRMSGPLPPNRARHILIQMCGSLSEAHNAGLIHRDIKPANAILCERGGNYDVVKVCDFGLVTDFATGERTDDHKPAVVGTPRYMAPEAFKASSKIDPRTDIYSLGVLAYFLLTGKTPFMGKTIKDLARAHLKEAPPPPSHHVKTIPADMEDLILQCMEKKPENRPQSAETLQDALHGIKDIGAWTRRETRDWWHQHLPDKLRKTHWSPEPPKPEDICGRLMIQN
ncbi:MAG: serine/threonine-protein kinase, partial [Verrucomicrobiota bacterium]